MTNDTIEIYWAMPDGGTADAVTWPQTYDSTPETLDCGVTYQVDTYTPDEAAIFTADGILTQGEDYGSETQTGAISWRFEYGGDCVEVPPVVDVCTNIDGVQETIPEGMELSNELCVPADVPVPSEPPVVVAPPAAPPAPVVDAPVVPVVVGEATTETATEQPMLAETGPDVSPASFVVAAALIVAGSVALVSRKLAHR